MLTRLLALTSLSLALGCGAAPTDLDDATPEGDQEIGAQSYLGSALDNCGGQLRVLNKNGQLQTIPRGVSTRVDLGGYRFRWYCGSTAEFTTCDVGTRYVRVLHSTESRRIFWSCYS